MPYKVFAYNTIRNMIQKNVQQRPKMKNVSTEIERILKIKMELVFYRAAIDGDMSKVKQLIETGIDVNAVDTHLQIQLIISARFGENDVANMYLEGATGGFQLISPVFSRATATGYAACYERVDIVKTLIEAGADVNAAALNDGASPLVLASSFGNVAMAKLLLEAGADVNTADHKGKSALYWAASYGHADVVKMLLEAGADVNSPATDRMPVLIGAAAEGNVDVVNMLLEAGVDVNAADEKNRLTALIGAAAKGHVQMVNMLLEAGAETDAADKDGKTAINYATEKGHADVVKILYDGGARFAITSP